MTLTAYLDAIEARVAAATKGVWIVYRDGERFHIVVGGTIVHSGSITQADWVADIEPDAVGHSEEQCEADANLLAHARTDLPRLVQGLRLAAKAMDQARRESASEPDSPYARNATTILNATLAALDTIMKGEHDGHSDTAIVR